ncbi:MAG: response regulator transcription factor [Thermotogota bacterium]
MIYKILLVEDDKKISEIIEKYLKKKGFNVDLVFNGIDALEKFSGDNFHLIILDIMMPGISGFEVLSEIRTISDIPVIIVTAKKDEVDRLNGFNKGADDYIVKPFSPKELVKRVEVIIKRAYKPIKQKRLLIFGDLKLDLVSQKLYKGEKNIEISSKEFNILRTFFENTNIPLSREKLIKDSFGFDYEGFDRNIDSYIKNIRKKIEIDTRNPDYIKTIYGFGYLMGSDED